MFLKKYIFALKFKFLGNKKNYVIYVCCFYIQDIRLYALK